jgi:DNA replication and repair protein RecF
MSSPATGVEGRDEVCHNAYNAPMTAARIRRLTLTNFRSYCAASVTLDGDAVVLIGANGAGKTNLIEAISFLGPGRGLRWTNLDDVAHRGSDDDDAGGGAWAVSAEVEGALGLVTLGTGIETSTVEDATTSRRCRIDREPVGSAAAFADHLRIVWMVPAMDSLFTGAAGERRRFLDRLVLAIDPGHAGRVGALERSLRSRNRLLEAPHPDPHWLDAVEHETAELAVAVAAARAETVNRLAAVLAARRSGTDIFPTPTIAIDGWVESLAADQPAAEIEDRYRTVLRDSRARDAAAGRTLDGPHRSDLKVVYTPKGIAAHDASTGEQKALLIGLVLAHAALVAEMTGAAPVILLDEVVAHLDPQRRAALFGAIARLGAQVWMTGADPAAFADIADRVEWLDIAPGTIVRRC